MSIKHKNIKSFSRKDDLFQITDNQRKGCQLHLSEYISCFLNHCQITSVEVLNARHRSYLYKKSKGATARKTDFSKP